MQFSNCLISNSHPFVITELLLFLVLPPTPRIEASTSIRPAPSHLLPVVELMEPPGKVYDPRVEDTNPIILRQKLGAHYDPEVMSEVEPEESLLHPNGTVKLKLKKTRAGHIIPEGPPPKYIQRAQLQNVRLGDGKRIPLRLGNKMRRRFRDLLWLQSYCPLLQKWRDLGSRFWPRWFLENSCAQRASCSFPRGMSCRPKKSTEKILLRWHCQNWEQQLNCQWLRVQYPQVTECKCGC